MRKRTIRMNQILSLLEERQDISVRDLAEHFSVSEITIRRDLNELKNDDNIVHHYGRVSMSKKNINDSYELFPEKGRMIAEKERIGKYAISLLQADDLIIIDTGTTTDFVAKYLPENLDLDVLCYTYNALTHLVSKPRAKIIFPGGYFHPNSQFFESPQGTNLIESIRVNKLFLSASGIHEKLGITCGNNYEVRTKRAVLNSAQTRILLADSSKFGKLRLAYFAQLDEIDIIVTDDGISNEWKELIYKHNIDLRIV